MIDEVALKRDFDEDGYSPYQLSIKYNISIEEVYRILKSDEGDCSEGYS